MYRLDLVGRSGPSRRHEQRSAKVIELPHPPRGAEGVCGRFRP